MRLSLRYRLLLSPAIVLVGTIAVTGWAARSAAVSAETRIVDELRAVVRTVEGPPMFRLTDAVLNQLRQLSGAEFHLDGAGERLQTLPMDQLPKEAVPADSNRLGPPVRIGNAEYRGVRVTLSPSHPNAGAVLGVFYPEDRRKAAIDAAVRPAFWLGLTAGCTTAVFAWVTSRRVVRRIRAVDVGTKTIATGRFLPIPLPAADDELRDLTATINDLARQLADYQSALARTERMNVLAQLSGGLAHQLRNSAAGARLAVQVYLDDRPTDDTEPLQVALRQLTRMEATLRQFLELGKPFGVSFADVDVGQVIGTAIESLRPQCAHAGTVLDWQPPEPIIRSGDAVQLGYLFGNVIGNAVEAAGLNGRVEVRVIDGEPLRVEVFDSGPGVPEAVGDRLFEEFVTSKPHGVGLGLAVAKRAAEIHGGAIRWHRNHDGTVFTVELPRAG